MSLYKPQPPGECFFLHEDLKNETAIGYLKIGFFFNHASGYGSSVHKLPDI